MRVEEFEVKKRQKLSAAIAANFSSISFAAVQKLFRQKDVKVNGKRLSKDVIVEVGDIVCFYINEIPETKLDILFEDENILVVFKLRKLETISETGELDLLKVIKTNTGFECFAVHRLDRNTEGLVCFAKNHEAKKSLDCALKNRTIEKFYLAEVFGFFEKKEDELIAYLKKYADKSFVDVSSQKKVGYDKIQTNYKVVKELDDSSLIEIELITGKTHQIRAHMAHIGHFVIGDEKYGDSNINKKFRKKYQNLCAYKIIFHFDSDDYLSYLDGKIIELDKNKIEFCQNL